MYGGFIINRIVFIGIILIVGILFTVYKLPFNIETKQLASTLDGTTVEISIKFKGYRYFFSPTKYSGELKVNDNELYVIIGYPKNESFYEKLRNKINGKFSLIMLVEAIKADNGYLYGDTFATINWASEKFNMVYLILKNEHEFYAPAQNSQEAKSIAEIVAKKLTRK